MLRIIVLIIFFGLYFLLGYSFGINNANALDKQSEIGYNIEDPNLDLYYDRDSGR